MLSMHKLRMIICKPIYLSNVLKCSSEEGDKTSTSSKQETSSESAVILDESYPVTCLTNFAKGYILYTAYFAILYILACTVSI